MSEPAIAVEGLRAGYGPTAVLHGIGFEVAWGRVCGYLGPNGSGKSTTLRVLTGLHRPQAGTVRLAGLDPASGDLEARRLLGYVPDSGGLYQLLTPREHLALVTEMHEVPVETSEARIDAVSERLDLDAFLDRRIDSLSKGQRQRVAIACGIVHEPKILLLDEPLSGLDVDGVRAIREVIRDLAGAGSAVLYCSHLLDVVERVCDQVVILVEGKIAADAPTTELLARSIDGRLESLFHSLTRREARGTG